MAKNDQLFTDNVNDSQYNHNSTQSCLSKSWVNLLTLMNLWVHLSFASWLVFKLSF